MFEAALSCPVKVRIYKTIEQCVYKKENVC